MDVVRAGHLPVETGENDEPRRQRLGREVRVESKLAVDETVFGWVDVEPVGQDA